MDSDDLERDEPGSLRIAAAACAGMCVALLLAYAAIRRRRAPGSMVRRIEPAVKSAPAAVTFTKRRRGPFRVILLAVGGVVSALSVGIVALAGYSAILAPDLFDDEPDDRQPPKVASRDFGTYPRPARAIFPVGSWISSDDYPPASLRDGRAGTVKVGFGIDTAGRVHDCWIMRSSGSPLLDNTACGLIEERGRYYPARDPIGRAVASSTILRFTWKLPD